MPIIACFIKDLLFRSQVSVATKDISQSILFIDDAGDERLKNATAAIFDLSGGSSIASLRQVRTLYPTLPTMAYLPHVEKSIEEEAKQLGCERIISRKEFSQNLRTLIDELLKK